MIACENGFSHERVHMLHGRQEGSAATDDLSTSPSLEYVAVSRDLSPSAKTLNTVARIALKPVGTNDDQTQVCDCLWTQILRQLMPIITLLNLQNAAYSATEEGMNMPKLPAAFDFSPQPASKSLPAFKAPQALEQLSERHT